MWSVGIQGELPGSCFEGLRVVMARRSDARHVRESSDAESDLLSWAVITGLGQGV